MNELAPASPEKTTTPAIMYQVLLALMPGSVLMIWWFGFGVAKNLLLAAATALLVEAGVLALRQRPLRPALRDGSALLSAALLALGLPSTAPWWLPVTGALVAMLLGKHLFGGLGMNLFNPAMTGYAVLLISFPREMSQWPDPTRLPSLLQTLASFIADSPFDALSRPTPLDQLRSDRLYGLSTGHAGWYWPSINLAFLAGGLFLLWRRLVDYRIPVTILLVLVTLYGFDTLAKAGTGTIWQGLFFGATILGAFFIATDPVTAPASGRGRLVFAAGIALLIYAIRRWGSYPDAIAFSVLLMNLCVPLIDNLTLRRR